jgi:hypothetical protein
MRRSVKRERYIDVQETSAFVQRCELYRGRGLTNRKILWMWNDIERNTQVGVETLAWSPYQFQVWTS